MKSVMSHSFSQVPKANIQRSSFNRSHGFKTTFDSGYLVPHFWDFVYPGDTFKLNTTVMARLLTQIVPIMDNMVADTFYFAVPIRLLWSNWKKFNGEQINPGDSTSYLCPISTSPAGGYAIGSLSDYLGLPTGVVGYDHITFWHRAYNLIYNEWFRDQNLQSSVTVDLGDGPDTVTNYVLLRRGKRHDYFTSCLPWPQKGTAVSIPLGTSAPIRGQKYDGTVDDKVYLKHITPASPDNLTVTAANAVTISANANPSAGQDLFWQQSGYSSGVSQAGFNYADLSNATAATINALRQAFQIQKLYERDARGGTRYTEIIRSHFGVVSPDARLQRPEYLGGGSSKINVHPIAQTSAGATDVTPQGNLSALATFSGSGHGFTKSFTEHCVLLGLVNVRADLNYQQGLNRMFTNRTRFDYFWPALAQIGEQAVLNKEIYCQGTAAPTVDAATFGYQERYAELRYKPSQITGKFRSTAAGTLDKWHLAENFTAVPTLGATFIVSNPPVSRIVAVTSQPQFQFDCYHDLVCARPMPTYGVPGNMDRF